MKNNADWRHLLQEMLAEIDPTALRQKADALETALYFCSQELQSNPDGEAERKALAGPSHTLLKIRIEKLGFPLDAKFLNGNWARQAQK
jgi:hypothetical protein